MDGELVEVLGSFPPSGDILDDGLNGLVDGVGREVFGIDDGGGINPGAPLLDENLEGRVPARTLRWGLCNVFSMGGTRSGKPSWLGDSGIVSRRGVDPPLAGGPHMFGVDNPSCAWISRALVMTTSD